jgi:hypothetical protein
MEPSFYNSQNESHAVSADTEQKNISPTLERKFSRKVLERKSHIDYDDDIVIPKQNEEQTEDEVKPTFEVTVKEYLDVDLAENNPNTAFDELFETAAATIQPEMQYNDAFRVRKLSSLNTSRKSINEKKSKTPSPPSSTTFKTHSHEYVPNSDANPKYDASYLGAPNTLTRSVSCKRPASFKRMRSKASENVSSNYTLKPEEKGLQVGISPNQQGKSQNRTGSLPFDSLEVNGDDFYRVRRFNITSKGAVINRGDSFKRSFKQINHQSMTKLQKHMPSTDNMSDGSVPTTPNTIGEAGSNKHVLFAIENTESIVDPEIIQSLKTIDTYTVCVLGSVSVGKTALIKQFQTSEYSGTYDMSGLIESIDDEVDKPVSVMLDGIESNLVFTSIDIENNTVSLLFTNPCVWGTV